MEIELTFGGATPRGTWTIYLDSQADGLATAWSDRLPRVLATERFEVNGITLEVEQAGAESVLRLVGESPWGERYAVTLEVEDDRVWFWDRTRIDRVADRFLLPMLVGRNPQRLSEKRQLEITGARVMVPSAYHAAAAAERIEHRLPPTTTASLRAMDRVHAEGGDLAIQRLRRAAGLAPPARPRRPSR